MKFSLLLFLLTVAVYTLAKPDVLVNDRKAHGIKALLNDWPFVVSIYIDKNNMGVDYKANTQSCTGSMIAKDIVLTAAHCLDFRKAGDTYKNAYFTIAIDSLNDVRLKPDDKATICKGSQFVYHDGFNVTGFLENDIGLIKIGECNKEITTNLQFVNVPKISDLPSELNGLPVSSAGWGNMAHGDTALLLEANFTAMSARECRKEFIMHDLPHLKELNPGVSAEKILAFAMDHTYYKQKIREDTMICSKSPVNGECMGDSGGPLVFKDGADKVWQVGIVSFGDLGCFNITNKSTYEGYYLGDKWTPGLPDVYTFVPAYYDWIQENMAKLRASDEPMSTTTDQPQSSEEIPDSLEKWIEKLKEALEPFKE